MTNEIHFVNDITVELIDSMGGDDSVVRAMLVSTKGAESRTAEGTAGRIGFLMKNRHASPFEHMTATFMIDCPIFVVREWHRHRTQSYNETSGRYRELEPRFYVPPATRPLTQVGKPGAYTLVPGDEQQYRILRESTEIAYRAAFNEYQTMLSWGVAKEVARDVLPVGIMTQFYATANLRNWLNFLSLRTDKSALWEIRQAAGLIEFWLTALAPLTMEAWRENGRGSL